ncbi:MAG: PepSY-like domain-containing protein [Tannerellaceae bacterium]|jgi:hypothetical protein|nr:PepSY-like domain-containing protein [Tannerellaceae bacterium]
MKLKLYAIAVIAFACLLAFSSCSSEPDDNPGGSSSGETPQALKPSDQVTNSFHSLYPTALQVTWSIRQNYYVADFQAHGSRYRTWFTMEGVMVVEKKYISYAELPPAVVEAFSQTSYRAWDIRTTYLLSRKDFAGINGISVILNGKISNLYFTVNGNYIRVADDFSEYSDSPVNVPPALQNQINSMFNLPELVDLSFIDLMSSEISVGIISDRHFVTAVFSSNYSWIVNFWEMALDELPDAVREGYLKSPYATFPCLHSRVMETPLGVSYLFYIVRNSKTIIIEFDAKGHAITELSRKHAITKYLLIR